MECTRKVQNTLCLCMIVKDESKIIHRALRSVLDIIDYWCIVDTGSTDNTKEIILETLKDIPGELVESEWIDFGHNRTEAIELADGKSDYILIMDADMVLLYNKDKPFKDSLLEDSYFIRYAGNLDYRQKMLVKSGLQWKYIGRTHEYIRGEDKSSAELTSAKLNHIADGESRLIKLKRDLRILTEDIDIDPENPRNLIYLAHTHSSLGNFEEAERFYKERIELGGAKEETWQAKLYLATLAEKTEKPFSKILELYLDAYNFMSSRAEPLYELSRVCRAKEYWPLAELFAREALELGYPTRSTSAIDKAIYRWKLLDELAIATWYNGKYKESLALCDKLLDENRIPKIEEMRVATNKRWALTALKRRKR
jgi:glycosyltransferase involved in cell wall biosynthesis